MEHQALTIDPGFELAGLARLYIRREYDRDPAKVTGEGRQLRRRSSIDQVWQQGLR